MNTNQLKQIITPWATQLPFPVRIYLFGSQARGNQTSESDMDIAIEVLLPNLDRNSKRNKVFDIENNLYTLLNNATGLPVHVVFYDGNPNTRKGHDIVNEGHILFSPKEHKKD